MTLVEESPSIALGRAVNLPRNRVTRLVYAEEFEQVEEAIAREKQLKGWKRIRKNELVRAAKPQWQDLMDGGPA